MTVDDQAVLLQEVARLQEQVASLNLENAALRTVNEQLQRNLRLWQTESQAKVCKGLSHSVESPISDGTSPCGEGPTHVDIDSRSFIEQDPSVLNTEDDELPPEEFDSAETRSTPDKVASYTLQLPSELLYAIFQRAIPPTWLLDPSLSLGPNSSWAVALRLKKSIVTVCSSWRSIGLQFLYEDICIRRLHQFKMLLRTIQLSPVEIGNLVKTLNIHCYVPQVFAADFTKYLGALFSNFPRITTFACTSPIALPTQASISITMPYSVTRLDLTSPTSSDLVVGLLIGSSSTLTSLRLRTPFAPPYPVPKGEIVLRCLVSMYLHHQDEDDGASFVFLAQHFYLPSLSKFTLHVVAGPGANDGGLPDALLHFLVRHGTNLLFLNFYFTPPFPDHLLQHVQNLPQLCPHLQHLIIPINVPTREDDWLDTFVHPVLEWIDFTHSSSMTATGELSKISLRDTNLPALRGSRIVSDLPYVALEWLENFPPDAVTNKHDRFTIDFYPSQLLHGLDYVYWQRQAWSYSGWECPDEFSTTFRDVGWPNLRIGRQDNSLELLLDVPLVKRRIDFDPSDGSYVYETDSSDDDLASDIESEEDITQEDDAEIDISAEILAFV